MNRKTIASILLTLGCVLSACGGAPPNAPNAAASSAAPLDGTSYEVTLTFPGEAPLKDTLRFEGGRFESTACTSVGFPQWSDYKAQPEGAAIAFAVLAKSADGTTMDWKGSVTGTGVDGTATRTLSGRTAVASVHGARR